MIANKLDTCGCCEGENRLTPADAYNPPWLDALTFRVGTHAAFFETMIADLARREIVVTSYDGDGEKVESRFRPLTHLKTRRRDDFSIALLDAWATIADVLTFYQERIANEGYLRTATERRSILELARLVGYELAPGVAASTFLSFVVNQAEGAALIPKGTRAQSIPEPGEIMQSFETLRDLEARYEYNELRLRLTRPQFLLKPPSPPTLPATLYLPGQRSDLRPPDRILLAFREGDLFRTFDEFKEDAVYYCLARVKSASLTADPVRTAVSLEPDPVEITNPGSLTGTTAGYEWAGTWAQEFYAETPWYELQGLAVAAVGGAFDTVPPESVVPSAGNQDAAFQGAAALNTQFAGNIYAVLGQEVAPLKTETDALRAVVLLRLQAHLHGYKAPWRGASRESMVDLPGSEFYYSQYETVLSEWPDRGSGDKGYDAAWDMLFQQKNANGNGTLTLDGVYEQVGVGGLVVLAWRDGGARKHALFRVKSTELVSTGLFNVPATATRLELAPIKGHAWEPRTMEVIRSTTVYAASELVLNPVPHRVLDLEPMPDTHTVSVQDVQKAGGAEPPDKVWQVIAEHYDMSAELLAAANDKTVQDALQPGETLVLPVGKELELDGIYQGLQPGRWIALSGMRTDIPAVGQKVALVQAVEHRFAQTNIGTADNPQDGKLPGDLRHTFLRLTDPPSLPFRRGELRLSANVVKATHGETARGIPPREQDVILGSGNGAEAHQRFPLKLQPGKRLTYLSAPTASGVESTLQVYVGEVLWQPRETLLDTGPTEHVYTVRTDDDGQVMVVCGDGIEGARPPTGRENVWARYRVGIGKAGNVRAGQISLLATRPPGVKEVGNWVPATGGTDPEGRDQARQNVRFAARTLDRLVGLQDYEDFSRTFAGIGKALARPGTTDDGRDKVTVYVAGQDNAPLKGSNVVSNLKAALEGRDGSNVDILVEVFTPRLISLDATVHIAPDRLWERVQPAVRAALEARFAFGRRELGQAVALSEIVRTIQEVPGVGHVQITGWAALTEEDLREQAVSSGKLPDVDEKAVLDVGEYELAFIDPSVSSLIVLREPQA